MYATSEDCKRRVKENFLTCNLPPPPLRGYGKTETRKYTTQAIYTDRQTEGERSVSRAMNNEYIAED